MSGSANPADTATPDSGRLRGAWLWFFAAGTFAAGLGFAFKIHEFTDDLLAEEGIQFAGVHLMTYVLVAGGFLALLAFSFLKGHFSDIERPKYELLERERMYDQNELC